MDSKTSDVMRSNTAVCDRVHVFSICFVLILVKQDRTSLDSVLLVHPQRLGSCQAKKACVSVDAKFTTQARTGPFIGCDVVFIEDIAFIPIGLDTELRVKERRSDEGKKAERS